MDDMQAFHRAADVLDNGRGAIDVDDPIAFSFVAGEEPQEPDRRLAWLAAVQTCQAGALTSQGATQSPATRKATPASSSITRQTVISPAPLP